MEFQENYENFQPNLMNIIFKRILNNKIGSKNNILLENIQNETLKIFSYLENKIKKFPELSEKQFSSLEESINYLESIEIPYNCECARVIDNIPGWRCLDCSDFLNSIYCSKCYLKSKEIHKGHKITFLPFLEGLCDCGDPNSLTQFCPDHKGPFNEQKQIDEFIEKSFPPNI